MDFERLSNALYLRRIYLNEQDIVLTRVKSNMEYFAKWVEDLLRSYNLVSDWNERNMSFAIEDPSNEFLPTGISLKFDVQYKQEDEQWYLTVMHLGKCTTLCDIPAIKEFVVPGDESRVQEDFMRALEDFLSSVINRVAFSQKEG